MGTPSSSRLAALPRTPTVVAVRRLGGGLWTSVLAALTLVWAVVVLLTCLVGVGLLLVPGALQAIRATADRERARLTAWGPAVVGAGERRTRLGPALRDPVVRRDTAWLAIHGTWGLLLGLVGLCLPLFAVRDLTFPLWWSAAPDGEASAALWFWVVNSWSGAWLVALSSIGWFVLTIALCPRLAALQARSGRRLLAPPPGTDLPLRIATLTATRAAALDAHATELRRIERALHDSTQNPLVAATVLIGAARRKIPHGTDGVDDLLEQAQTAVEQALGELRVTVRGILPPVLADRGLDGAISGLAATMAIPTLVDVSPGVRCPASVEASAYFMVSEALTNIARHSGAAQAWVTVQSADGQLDVLVGDDGHGGADETSGSGLAGIRRRVEAHDGTLEVSSPVGGPTTLRARLPCGS
jgi:signal transduction histidine kinase